MSRPQRILVVDDERLIRMSLSLVLGREGFQVDTAGSRAEAMDLIDCYRYELVYTDLRLPDGGGLEVAEYARRVDPSVAIVLLTASDVPDLEGEAARAGADAVLLKPFRVESLANGAREILRGRGDRPTT